MLTCDTARELLALDAQRDDPALEAHVASCARCAAYRRRSRALDSALRDELRWEVPAALTLQLLALASGRPLAPARPRPQGWYVTVVYGLTLLAVAMSIIVAWQVAAALATQIGVPAALTQLLAAPSRALAELTTALPESRYVVDFFFRVRDQLIWLLAIAIVWAALDRAPQRGMAPRRA